MRLAGSSVRRYTMLPSVVIVVALLIVANLFAWRGHEHLTNQAGEVVASQWAQTFILQTDAMDRILSGEPLRPDQRALLESIAQLGSIFRFKVFDADGTLLMLSDQIGEPAAGSLQKHNPGVLEKARHGIPHTEVFHGHDNPKRPDAYAETYVPMMENGRLRGIVEVYVDVTHLSRITGDKLKIGLFVTIAVGLVAIGHALYAAWLLRIQRTREEEIHRLAHHDALTGATNRRGFSKALDAALKKDEPAPVALHVIDVDAFKSVNDTFGHDVGDALLHAIAQTITDCLGPSDVLSRLGGDEFGIIQTDVTDPGSAAALAAQLVERARNIREIGGVPITTSLSVGVAAAPWHGNTPEGLRKAADVALYRAKEAGRDTYVLFKDGMDTEIHARNQLRIMLRDALETDGFVLLFQPLHDAADGELTSFEALLRLPDGQGGFVSPSRFIPLAEDMGLTPRLGEWVIRKACATATEWPESINVSVNLSPQQFEEDIVAIVFAALTETGLSPQRLELEITENLFIRDPKRVGEQLNALKGLGVRIAMDDFGTGYSSLSYLWKFPFDKVKVDRTCFQSLEDCDNVREVLRTIIAMSEAMNIKATAEGIETEAQRTFAREAGYNELQGFYYHRPMDAGSAAAYIARGGPDLAPGAHGATALSPDNDAKPVAPEGSTARNAA